MTIDITRLEYHDATYDASGQPVLKPKPLPPEYHKADPVSRRTYTHMVAKEAEAVLRAAQEAQIPDKPPNWSTGTALDRLTWHHQVKRGG